MQGTTSAPWLQGVGLASGAVFNGTTHLNTLNDLTITNLTTCALGVLTDMDGGILTSVNGADVNLTRTLRGNGGIVVTNHAEPDHSGSLPALMQLCPNATVVVSKMGAKSVPAPVPITATDLPCRSKPIKPSSAKLESRVRL